MNKRIFNCVMLAALVVPSVPSWAYFLDGGAIDVGGVDDLVASTRLSNSGDETERRWVERALRDAGVSVTSGIRFDDEGMEWERVDGQRYIFAHEITAEPQYFLIKTGNRNEDGHSHFLYQNISAMNYAVIDLRELRYDRISISRVSHLSTFNSSVSVPEPGALALLGLGLLGLGIARRRATKAK